MYRKTPTVRNIGGTSSKKKKLWPASIASAALVAVECNGGGCTARIILHAIFAAVIGQAMVVGDNFSRRIE